MKTPKYLRGWSRESRDCATWMHLLDATEHRGRLIPAKYRDVAINAAQCLAWKLHFSGWSRGYRRGKVNLRVYIHVFGRYVYPRTFHRDAP